MNWEDLKVIGYINGKAEIERKYLKNPTFKELQIFSDDKEINSINEGAVLGFYKNND